MRNEEKLWIEVYINKKKKLIERIHQEKNVKNFIIIISDATWWSGANLILISKTYIKNLYQININIKM